MKKSKQLVINTFILFLGKICTQFISFLLLPIFTSYLTKSEYGYFDLIQNYIVVLVPIVSLQIEMAVYKYIIESKKDNENENIILSNALLFTFFISILIFIIINLITIFKSNIIYLFVSIMLILNIILNILFQYIRGKGKNLLYSKTCIFNAILNSILCFLFIVRLKFGIIGAIIPIIISNFLSIIYIFINEKIISRLSIKTLDIRLIKSMLKYSVPLIPTAVIWWIINISDRTIITLVIGADFNSIYAVSNKFSAIISSFFNIFIMSWTETVFLYIDDDKDNFISNVFSKVIDLLVLMSYLLCSIMFLIFPIMIKGNYDESYNLILPLIYSTIFSNLAALLTPIYLAKNKSKKVLNTSLVSGLINLIINIIFIKKFGLFAAVLSTLFAFIYMYFYRYYDVKKYIKINIPMKKILLFVCLGGINIYLYYINNIYSNFTNFLIMFLIFMFYNKEVIIKFINKFIKR